VVLGLPLVLLALVGGMRLLLVLLKGTLLLLLKVQLLLAVAVRVPPPVLLLLLVRGMRLLLVLLAVQPDKATVRITTRSAVKTEALIVFIVVFIFG